MPMHNNTINSGNHTTIRDDLENIAWMRDPGLARRLSKRLQRKRKQVNRDITPNRIMRWQDRTLLALGVILMVLVVIRSEVAVADNHTWGLEMRSDKSTYTEMALNTAIQLDITGLVARVHVTQQFSNQGDHWAEGIYRFPLPLGAAVDRLQVKVGDRLLEGEIQERETARRTYQKARDSGRTATVVEQQRRNQFETRLANIGPGEAIEITISYLQNIRYSDLSYHLRIPMTFTPRWEPGQAVDAMLSRTTAPAPLQVAASGTGHRLTLSANLVSAMELAAIESRYHDVDIRQADNGYQVELLNTNALTDWDFELSWTPMLQSSPSTSLTTYSDGESVYAQLMLAPPLADSLAPQAREVVLIIDTSGSMEGASLAQAKDALAHALDFLGPDDYFNLLQFNSTTEKLFDQSVPVTHSTRYVAQNFITSLKANGGTDMAPALAMGLGLPPAPGLMRQVVFITDGAVGNETDLLQQVAGNLGDSRLFTIAIGHAPNSWFMRKAAELGRGSFVHIGKPQEVGEQMSMLWGRIQLPALTNICVEWGDTAEYYPEIIPDLYAGEPLWLIAKLPADPTVINLCGNLNGEDWDMTINGWDAVEGDDNLAMLWARKKVEALEDSLMFGADRELTQLEITGTALDYGLLTRHTSLVAVDKTPRRGITEPLAREDIPSLLPAGSSSGLAGYPATATGWLTQLLLSLFVLLLASVMLIFSGSRLPMTEPSTHAR